MFSDVINGGVADGLQKLQGVAFFPTDNCKVSTLWVLKGLILSLSFPKLGFLILRFVFLDENFEKENFPIDQNKVAIASCLYDAAVGLYISL